MFQIEESLEESEVSGEFNPFREDPAPDSTDLIRDDSVERNDPFGNRISAEILERRIELVETDDCTSLDTTVTTEPH